MYHSRFPVALELRKIFIIDSKILLTMTLYVYNLKLKVTCENSTFNVEVLKTDTINISKV